jgi:hypothetical protein
MKKEILKGLSMLTLIVGLAFVTAVVSANGQTQIVSDVPFNFVVGEKTMPAGQYSVTQLTAGSSALLIAEKNAKSSSIRLATDLEPKRSKTQARMVFHRYGQNYFLAEVWKGGDSFGKKLQRSRQERAIERELASIISKSELAQSTYEIVELVAVVR